jgi:5-(carboxyamino)imidazole ribonucleotide synthase
MLATVPLRPLLAEQRVAFRRELAAQVARSPIGQAVAYPIVESLQRDGICAEVIAPAPRLPERVALRAQEIALLIADQLGVTGMLAVEMFEVPSAGGGDPEIVVNELAMRPHNSGHWSIDGAVTDQIEQHLRAVLDLPLGDPRARARETVMVNVLGGSRDALWTAYPHVMAGDPALRVHLYGKAVRPGRKVGHVTVTSRGREPLVALLERARHAADYLADIATDEATNQAGGEE